MSNDISLLDVIKKSPNKWMLTYIGEDHHEHLRNFVDNLNKNEGKSISSGHSYWGVGPTSMWHNAVNSVNYHMLENIDLFKDFYIDKLTNFANDKKFNWNDYDLVSFGPGEGTKDKLLLNLMFNHGANKRKPYYFPVDLSIEMLHLAIKNLPSDSICDPFGLQIDFSNSDAVNNIKEIVSQISTSGRKTVYTLLGNTASNFEDSLELLQTITNIMSKEDLFLIELQRISDCNDKELVEKVKREYSDKSFMKFALNSLMQNTDLKIIYDKELFNVDPLINKKRPYGEYLDINVYYTPIPNVLNFDREEDRKKYSKFAQANLNSSAINTSELEIKKDDKILVYKSKKFPSKSSLKMLSMIDNVKVLADWHGPENGGNLKGLGSSLFVFEKQ